jgi:hypothetical protein
MGLEVEGEMDRMWSKGEYLEDLFEEKGKGRRKRSKKIIER